MTDNEKIARWLGYTRFETSMNWQWYPGIPNESWTKPGTGLTASIEFDTKKMVQKLNSLARE